MKSFSFTKAMTLGCLICLALPIACGDDDDDSGPSKPGAAGSGAGGEPSGEGGAAGMPALVIPGTSDTSKTVTCGAEMCKSVSTLLPTLFVDPCCTTDDACGVKTDFLQILGASFGANSCQAHDQVGDTDAACPNSTAQMLPVNGMSYAVPGFAGCCRAETGTCGVVVNSITASGLPFASPKLGCVDSAPFFAGEAAAPCGDMGAGGVGGGGGGGAAGMDSVGGGAGGAPAAGAAGAAGSAGAP